MVTVIEFLTRLGNSIVEFPVVLSEVVAMGDPLALVSLLVGALLMVFSFAVLGYLALGALGRELGILSPTPGHGPRETPPGH